jgi:molecular chaperone DnaK
MARTVGIDLGTTNSVVSFIEGTRVEVVPNAEGSNLTPSVVLYKSDDEIIVGELARRQLVTRPEAVVRSIKRIIGKRYADLDEDILDNLPFRVAELDDGMAAVVVHGDILMRPEEVSADILEALRNTAEAFLGEEVTEAVITVPAHFNDQQRTATKAAAELVGITVQRIINEPTAAALAYGMGSERDGTVAVFDFGGGTFDISILNIAGDVF